MSLLCKLGIHNFKNHCTICSRCGKESKKNAHKWNKCKCIVCGVTKEIESELHIWDEKNQCTTCELCKHEFEYLTSNIEYNGYSNDRICEYTYKCKYCGEIKKKYQNIGREDGYSDW